MVSTCRIIKTNKIILLIKNYRYMKKNLFKNLLTVAMLMYMVLPTYSNPVTENTALNVAVKILSPTSLRSSTDSTQQAQKPLKLLYKSSNSENSNTAMRSSQANKNETVYFYVFGTEDNKSFVIVAGDDRVTPILGYSETNGFSADNMPPNLQWWLGEYAKQIQFAIDNDIKPTQEVIQQWAQYLGTNNNGKEE